MCIVGRKSKEGRSVVALHPSAEGDRAPHARWIVARAPGGHNAADEIIEKQPRLLDFLPETVSAPPSVVEIRPPSAASTARTPSTTVQALRDALHALSVASDEPSETLEFAIFWTRAALQEASCEPLGELRTAGGPGERLDTAGRTWYSAAFLDADAPRLAVDPAGSPTFST
jgi:hypothetical protein